MYTTHQPFMFITGIDQTNKLFTLTTRTPKFDTTAPAKIWACLIYLQCMYSLKVVKTLLG